MNWWRKWIGGGRLSSGTTLKQRKLRAKDSREDLVDYLLEFAALAENEGDADTMRSRTYKLIRLELYERAWELRVRSAALKQPSLVPEWEGDDSSGRSILIRYYAPKHRIGEELRFARFIAPVARASRRCIVLSDPRLVALLGRSFSGSKCTRGGPPQMPQPWTRLMSPHTTKQLHCVSPGMRRR